MRVGVIVRLGVALGILVLPLVCLCQFVPGQTAAAPYLLLLPRSHAHEAASLTDEQLIDLAFTSGQSISVTDEGDILVGYGSDAPMGTAALAGARLHRQGAPPDLNPQIDAAGPAGDLLPPPVAAPRLGAATAGGGPQDQPAPPERPPRAA